MLLGSYKDQDWNHLSARDGAEVSVVQEEERLRWHGEDNICTLKNHLQVFRRKEWAAKELIPVSWLLNCFCAKEQSWHKGRQDTCLPGQAYGSLKLPCSSSGGFGICLPATHQGSIQKRKALSWSWEHTSFVLHLLALGLRCWKSKTKSTALGSLAENKKEF